MKSYLFFEIKTENIGQQLTNAQVARNQNVPTERQIEFWENRCKYDRIVLSSIKDNYLIYDISDNNWDSVIEQIVKMLNISPIFQDKKNWIVRGIREWD